MKLAGLGEFGLIDRLQNGLAVRGGVRVGIGDDAAVLESLACPVVTADALVEGIHFRRDWMSARQLGRRAMAVNLSDLAAMAAWPRAAFVALCLPKEVSVEWVQELYAGLEMLADQYQFTVAGGDTVRSPHSVMLSITLVGEACRPEEGPWLRSGAKAGDLIYVTGTLGDSAAGLHHLLFPEGACEPGVAGADTGYLLERHLTPEPRLHTMRAMLAADPVAVTAAMDLSDGLAGDARHLAQRSGVQLLVQAEDVPLSAQAQRYAAATGQDALDWALSGGEDFELLVTVDAQRAPQWEAALRRQGEVSLARLGRCVVGSPELVVLQNGRPRENRAAFNHFSP